MYSDRVLGIEDGIFVLRAGRDEEREERTVRRLPYLTGGVYDVTIIVRAVVVDGLRECTLDGWVVRLDEVVLDELNDER